MLSLYIKEKVLIFSHKLLDFLRVQKLMAEFAIVALFAISSPMKIFARIIFDIVRILAIAPSMTIIGQEEFAQFIL